MDTTKRNCKLLGSGRNQKLGAGLNQQTQSTERKTLRAQLLVKLAMKQLMRSNNSYVENLPRERMYKPLQVQYKSFEMEDPQQSSSNVLCDTAGDITLQSPIEQSTAEIKPLARRRFTRAADSSSGEKFSLTDTWIQLDVKKWDSTHQPNSKYWEYVMPQAIMGLESLPQLKPFRIHQYGSMDMVFKIQCTGLKFLQGLLIASWYYHDELDAKFVDRKRKESMVMREHVIIDASSSNSGELRVPFISYQSMIQLAKRDELGEIGRLGSLVLTPFNAITGGPGASTSVTIVVSVKFENAMFVGKVPSSIGERIKSTEMFAMAGALLASKLLNNIEADANRDKPPYQGGSALVVPVASNNLSIGTNSVEPVDALRLDAKGQTPHPELLSDGMDILSVARTYGFIKTISITTDMQFKSRIDAANFPAAPIMDLKEYTSYVVDGHTAYYMPPVAVISSLFAKWRGSLRYRFQVVSSYFHQIKLLVGFVPHTLKAPTFSQILGCYCTEYDLIPDGPREFTFDVPYIANTPFWDNSYSTGVKSDKYGPPGKVYMFIRTPLQSNASIASNISLNVYVAAGDDFEVAIPCQPSFGLSFDAHGPLALKTTIAKPYSSGYGIAWYDSWFQAKTSSGDSLAVGRYDGLSDHVSEYIDLTGKPWDISAYWTFDDVKVEDLKLLSFTGKWTNESEQAVIPKYAIPLTVGDHNESTYVTCAFSQYQLVYIYYDITITDEVRDGVTIHTVNSVMRSKPNYDNCTVLVKVGARQWDKTNMNLAYAQNPAELNPQTIISSHNKWVTYSLRPLRFASRHSKKSEGNEMENKPLDPCDTRFNVKPIGDSVLMYGESFTSLKDLCRRWSPYARTELRVDFAKSQEVGAVSFSFPAMPAGLALGARLDIAASLIRDGPIPIVASNYRFFRGGLRFKFIFVCPNDLNLTFWVQHRPDRRCVSDVVSVGQRSHTDGIYNHGYATAVQSNTVNNVLTIEVPFYQRGPFGLLQRPKFTKSAIDDYFSLGEIVGGYAMSSFPAESALRGKVSVLVMYSLADDMTFYNPIGFPPVVPLGEYEEAKMFEMGDNIKEFETGEPSDNIEIEQVSSKSFFLQIVEYLTNTDIEYIKSELHKLKGVFNFDIGLESLILNIVTNCGHVLLTPTLSHVFLAIFSILLQMQIISLNIFTKILSCVNNVINSIGSANKHSEAEGEHFDHVSKLVVSLYTCIGTVCNIRADCMKGDKVSIMKVMSIFSTYSKGVKSMTDAMKMVLETMSWMCTRLWAFAASKTSLLKWWYAAPDVVDDYLKNAARLLHPSMEEAVLTTPAGYYEIDVCCQTGATLLRELRNHRHDSSIAIIMHYQRKLAVLRDEAAKSVSGLTHRREPYCVHVTGSAGIGKSQITMPTMEMMMREEGIQSSGQMIYAHNGGNKHWDSARRQPGMEIDEFLPVRDAQTEAEEVGRFLVLKSCTPFVPPQARLDDKGRFYSPELIWINSNVAYPDIPTCRYPDAVWRRYDDLVEVKWHKSVRGIVGDLNGKKAMQALKNAGVCISNYDHLEFHVKVNPENPQSEEFLPPKSYKQLCEYLCESFREHRKIHFELQAQRLNQQSRTLSDLHPSNIEETIRSRLCDDLTVETGLRNVGEIYEPSRPFIESMIIHNTNMIREAIGGPSVSKTSEIGEVFYDVEISPKEIATSLKNSLSETECDLVSKYLAVGSALPSMRASHRASALKPVFKPDMRCPHIWQTLLDCTYDEANSKFVSKNSYLDMRCAEHCNLDVAEYASECAKQLSLRSQYWKFELQMNPEILNLNEDYITQASVHDELKKALSAYVNKHDDRNNKLRLLGRFLGVIAIPIGYIGLRKLFGGSATEVATSLLPEVSPADYAAPKALANNKRASVLRRAIKPAITTKEFQLGTSTHKHSECMTVENWVQPIHLSKTKEGPTLEVVQEAVVRNTRFMILSGYDSTGQVVRRSCRILGVCGRYVVFPKHYIAEWDSLPLDGKSIAIYHLGQEFLLQSFIRSDLYYVDNVDVVIYQLPAKFPNFRDIRKFMWTYDILDKGVSRDGIFVEIIPDAKCTLGQKIVMHPIQMEPAQPQVVQMGDIDVHFDDGIVYRGVHGKGKCGSVCVDAKRSVIVGMHIAGGSGEGLSAFVVRDWFDELIGERNVCDPLTVEEYYPKFISVQGNPKIQLEGDFIEGPIISDDAAHRETGKTAYEPSEISGEVCPVQTQPAILSNKDPRAKGQSPMKLAAEKHSDANIVLNPIYVKMAVEHYTDQMYAKVKPLSRPLGPLTITEAIMGSETLPGLKPIEMNTSEGFPFTSARPKTATNKSWLFDFELNENKKTLKGIHPMLHEALEKNYRTRKSGKIVPTVFVDCSKDARLPHEKCLPNKTRLFSISPIDYTIQFRQYFSGFFQAFEKAGISMEHAIGIAVQKQDWTTLVRHMQTFAGSDGKHACGDYSAFGDTLAPELVEASMMAVVDWYYRYELLDVGLQQAVENKLIRECMLLELKNANHMCFNFIYQVLNGMPSGSPVTVYLNTMVNSLYMRIAWLMITEKYPELHHLDKMFMYLCIVTYGDDIWIAIKKEILWLFDNVVLHEVFSRMGIKYQDVRKDGNMRPYCDLHEVDFLKHKIVPHPTRKGKFLAALDRVSVEDCANWVHKSADKRAASIEACHASLMLAYGHGPEYYNKLKRGYTEAWSKRGVHYDGRDWYAVDNMFYAEDVPQTFLDSLPLQSTPAKDRAVLYAHARKMYLESLACDSQL